MPDIIIKESHSSSNKLFDGRYRLFRKISTEGSSCVWIARDMNTIDKNAAANDESSGMLVAIKICTPNTKSSIEDEQRWQDEFDAARDCHHANLLPPEEYAVFNETYYLVYPYTQTDSLRQRIGKNMSDKTAWKFISDIATGLNELHTHQPQIIHNEIKPSNILVFDNDCFVLTNYGIHFETDAQRIDNPRNDIAYMAPERFQADSAPQPENDIWALGAVLYEVLSGNKPFGDEGGKNQGPDTPMPPLPNQPTEIRDLIYACLQADPQKRPTAQQIKDAVRSKKLSFKPSKTKRPDQIKKPAGKSKKKWPIAVVAAVLLLLGELVYLLTTRHHDNDNPAVVDHTDKTEAAVAINYYEKAVGLLSDKATAASGRELLDSLAAANDWQAAYLLSRLYFDTRGNDTVFYDKQWKTMRNNCGIVPNNETAQKYLFYAFEQNENDFMILYQLGCDFKAGNMRGCQRNLNYALWCFDHAENTLKSSDTNHARYQQVLEYGRERISTSDYTPVKPSR